MTQYNLGGHKWYSFELQEGSTCLILQRCCSPFVPVLIDSLIWYSTVGDIYLLLASGIDVECEERFVVAFVVICIG